MMELEGKQLKTKQRNAGELQSSCPAVSCTELLAVSNVDFYLYLILQICGWAAGRGV